MNLCYGAGGELKARMAPSTWVVAALKERPSREQRPSPAATDRAISSTPASPTAPWDLVESHLSKVMQA